MILRYFAVSDATKRAYRSDLEEFAAWLGRQGLGLADVDTAAISDYASELGADRPGRTPRKLAPQTLARKLAAVRSLIRSALGPAQVPQVSLSGRRGRRLPHAPRPEETDDLLDALNGDDPLALRNRALFELLYSAGLRTQEAVDLTLASVDFEQEALLVRGKGGKERAVPLGEEAAYRLRVYLQDGRNDNRGQRNGVYDQRRDWFFQNVRLMQALTEKGYDVNYTWGIGKHGSKQGGAIFPDMMRWIWRDHAVSTDVNDAVERSFNKPAEKKGPGLDR